MGPFWPAGNSIGMIVGALNVAASSAEQETVVGEDLEDAVLKTYEGFSKAIKSTFSALLAGDFDGFDISDDDPIEFIKNGLGSGEMLVVDEKDKAVKAYMENFERLMKHMLVFRCLSDNKWELWVWDNQDEDGCKDLTEDTGLWLTIDGEEKCVAMVIRDPDSSSHPQVSDNWVKFLDDDKRDALKEFDVDLEDAYMSILDCDGDDPDFSDVGGLEGTETYPPCIMPMSIVWGRED